MVYKNIGQLCLEKEYITEVQLKLALSHQKKTGLLLGAVLVKLGYVTNQEVMVLLSEQREWYYNEKSIKESISQQDKGLNTIPIILLDIITTGINPDTGAEIAQLALLSLEGDMIIHKFLTNIKTRKPLTGAFKILHKVTQKDLDTARNFKDVIPILSKYFVKKPIFAYNVQSTINFIIKSFERERIPFTHNTFFDLITLWRKIHSKEGVGYLSLPQMCAEFNYPLSKPFNIEDSITASHFIYKNIIEELKFKKNVKSLRKLEAFQDRKFKFFIPDKTSTYFLVEKSILLKRKLQVEYFSPWTNETTARTIDPYELINQGNEYYLIAFCNLREEVRWFRLDRIKNLVMIDEPFEKKDYDLSQLT
ncbi:WYL domain-containing protein [Candidatus Dependentiae bacterium]|nr:WYL domain-containing protein [Candidatus Dependentiae bacterium]